ncbi:hypothetical protein EDF88_0427 [Buttiauxella sp. BIGb0552]|nr:hypothetical protein EDF88_0427 [Buttiauxella sp. BIGb0552]
MRCNFMFTFFVGVHIIQTGSEYESLFIAPGRFLGKL